MPKIPPKVSAAQRSRGGQLCHVRASPAVPTFPPRGAGAGIARIPRGALPPLQLFVAEAERVFFGKMQMEKSSSEIIPPWFSYSRVPDLVFPGRERGLQLSASSSRKYFLARGAAGHLHELKDAGCAPVARCGFSKAWSWLGVMICLGVCLAATLLRDH